ncbi:hypothetical protein ACVNF4_33145, partial [Streptomyces sp. S6]
GRQALAALAALASALAEVPDDDPDHGLLQDRLTRLWEGLRAPAEQNLTAVTDDDLFAMIDEGYR